MMQMKQYYPRLQCQACADIRLGVTQAPGTAQSGTAETKHATLPKV